MKKRLIAFFDPSRSIPLYIIGTSTLTLVLQAAYDFLNDPGKMLGGYWLAILSLVVSTFIFIGLLLIKPKPIYVSIRNEEVPPKHFALILLVSAQTAAAEDIIKHHSPTLHYCWLISSTESLSVANEIKEKYQSQIANIFCGKDYLVNPFDLNSTYNLVDRILTKDINELDPNPVEIMLDITGGTKLMTAGMVLAGVKHQAPMEYTQIVRDQDGGVAPGAVPQPTLIDIELGSSESLKG
ncbi:MAG: hypothetical protein HY863_02175 [Chloroflexi bacterium]|nr:hypothetical protein [Chloroflexota bacterium]